MDITLNKVDTVAFIQHAPDNFIRSYSSIIIYTETGKVTLELFGDKPMTIQLKLHEDD